MNTIAIIPARGGSKRIPRKNIKSFLGKPIIAYSIEAALNSNLFSEVMVSTDDHEIAEIALKYGAKVPFKRSCENSNDFADTGSVLIEVIEKYKETGKKIDYACCLYPCAPFITSALLDLAFQKMKNESLDAVFPIVKYSTPIQRAFKLENNKIKSFYPEYLSVRSQDLEGAYYDSGQFYFFKTDIFLREKKMVTTNSSGIIIDELITQDIDNENDWQLAELKYKLFTSPSFTKKS